MDEIEQYLFDVNGYIVVEDILSKDLLHRLNTAIDQCSDRMVTEERSLSFGAAALQGDKRRTEFADGLSWPKPHRAAFHTLLSLPSTLSYMLALMGDGFRLDSIRGTEMTSGTEGLILHGGGGNSNTLSYYHFIDGKLRNTLVNVAYALTDAKPDEGGFVCVPGSHKANLPCPSKLVNFELGSEHVKKFSIKAGSAIIFSEALIHGTMPWRGENPRRTLFVRYSPGAMAFRAEPRPDNYELFASELDPLQEALLTPPYHIGRPSIAELMKKHNS